MDNEIKKEEKFNEENSETEKDLKRLEELEDEELFKEMANIFRKLMLEKERERLNKKGHKMRKFNKRRIKDAFRILRNFIWEGIVAFLVLFSLNTYFSPIQSDFWSFCLFILIYNIIDYSFNLFCVQRLYVISILSFGFIHFVVTLLSFFATAIICVQITTMSFKPFGQCFILMIVYAMLKSFILHYFRLLEYRIKNKKRGNNNG